MNSGAQKYGGTFLGLRELRSAHKMKNHIGSERKNKKFRSANRVLPHFFKKLLLQYCFGFLFFSFSFDDVKFRNPLALFRKKEETIEIIFHFQNRKIICEFSTLVSNRFSVSTKIFSALNFEKTILWKIVFLLKQCACNGNWPHWPNSSRPWLY